MIIVLYGPNSYLRLRKLNEIIDIYKKRRGELNLQEFDVNNEEGLGSFKEYLRNISMFSPNKFIILDNAFEPHDKKELKSILKDNLEGNEVTILINSSDKPPADFKFIITPPSKSEFFADLKSDEEIISFIKTESSKKGINLSDADIFHLKESFDSDLWGIVTELEKMSLFGESLLEKKEKYEYFQILNSLKYGHSAKQRLIALEILLSDRGDEPGRIFNSLPFGLKDERMLDRLADYDVAVKSGKLEYEEVLLDFTLL